VNVQHPGAAACRDDHEAATVSWLSYASALELTRGGKVHRRFRVIYDEVRLFDFRIGIVLLPICP